MARTAILLLLLLAAPSLAFSPQQTLRIGTTFAPPLSLPDHSGILDRMLEEAFSRIGVQVEFVTLPSERSLADAECGVLDGDNNRIAGLQGRYPNLVQVPESNMTYEFMAFVNKPEVVVNGWQDLDRYEVAHIIGWKILEDNVTSPKVNRVVTPAQLFLLLKNGRAEVVLYDRYGGGYYLKQYQVEGGYAVEPPLARREMYLYLNARHAELAAPLAEALRAMKKDGSYARYFQQAK